MDGTSRTFVAQVPAGARAVPLVIVLHGNTQQGADMQARTGWPAVARREGFAVVFPDGLNRAWADGRGPEERAFREAPPGTDDVAFLRALIRHFVDAGIADPRRVYVTGLSNGGAMTLTFACRESSRIAAAAVVIMSFTRRSLESCAPAMPVPMLVMNGTADPLVAFDGQPGRVRGAVSHLLPTAETVRFWRRVDGCEPDDADVAELPDVDAGDRSTVTRVGSRCPPAVDVLLYRVNGGGHRMPGVSDDARRAAWVDRWLGPQNHDLDGALAIWRFFARFERP